MTGHKYYIYVEYFELPGFETRKSFFWRSNMNSLPAYWRNIRLAENGREVPSPRVRLCFMPTLRSSRRIRGSVKYKSTNVAYPSAIWVWDYKVRVVRNQLYNMKSDLLYDNLDHTPAAALIPLALLGHGPKFLDTTGFVRKPRGVLQNQLPFLSRNHSAFDTVYHRELFQPNKTYGHLPKKK